MYFAGDFNCSPTEGCYSLLTSGCLLREQEEAVELSRVVHKSRDPTVDQRSASPHDETSIQPDHEAVDPDRIIVNARRCEDKDGLLTIDEMQQIFKPLSRLRSAYAEGNEALSIDKSLLFGSRCDKAMSKNACFEPIWTSFTHYWQATLDYIFMVDGVGCHSQVTALLQGVDAPKLEPGLPRKGVCGSDHLSLSVEVVVTQTKLSSV